MCIRDRYKVRHKGTLCAILVNDSVLVMKQININQMSPLQKQEALNEAKILQSLNSPYIVGYYDSFIDEEKLCIIMEYCENGDLGQFLKARNKQYVEENIVLKYFIEACLALLYLHGKKILHRDIKTMNMFLTKDFHVKLGDLGVAKVLSQTSSFAHTIVGTPYYLSPEVCQELPYNTKSDIWSLGCALYEMCALKHPFEAKNQIALIMKIAKSSYEPLPGVYSREVSEIVAKCLQKNYKKRPRVNDILALPFIQQKAKLVKVEVPDRSLLAGRAEIKRSIADMPRKHVGKILGSTEQKEEVKSKPHANSESPSHQRINQAEQKNKPQTDAKPQSEDNKVVQKKSEAKQSAQAANNKEPSKPPQRQIAMATAPSFPQAKGTAGAISPRGKNTKKAHYATSSVSLQTRKKPPRVRSGAPTGLARKAREVARPVPTPTYKKPKSKDKGGFSDTLEGIEELAVSKERTERSELEDPDLFMKNIMGEDYNSIVNNEHSVKPPDSANSEYSMSKIFKEMLPETQNNDVDESEVDKPLLASVEYQIGTATVEEDYKDDFETEKIDGCELFYSAGEQSPDKLADEDQLSGESEEDSYTVNDLGKHTSKAISGNAEEV
eukprot:TRINITY_DN9485_c0_g2_i4.p1 TRINITY_DN9485_c0_g2~~TRINITY_DN9485_c0_g2_i4.p1  ORF type:complete len:610 (+),score=143.00 TRINITY_DN9485_c0_g2_i4:73-1902(+)